MSENQKLRYFHNIFHGEAKRYYKSYMQPGCNIFEESFDRIRNEYSSSARQNKVRKYLQNIALSSVTEEKSCNVAEAYEYFREIIKNSPLKNLGHIYQRKTR